MKIQNNLHSTAFSRMLLTLVPVKYFQNLFLILVCTCLMQAHRPSPDPVVFWASTPCDGYPRSFFSIPATADCEFVKWTLELHSHPRTQEPTIFKLTYTWGMSKPATEGFLNGGTQGVKEGTWTSVKEDSNRMVYKLTPAVETGQPIVFLKLQDNILHLLDQEGKLMIGHAGWSYTANRKQ